MFNRATGTDLHPRALSGLRPAGHCDLLGGEVQSAFNTTVALLPLYKDKQDQAAGGHRSSALTAVPDVPTFGELKMNLGDIETRGIVVRLSGARQDARSPSSTKLNASSGRGAQESRCRGDKLRNLDIEVATDTPEAFAKIVKADYERWGRVIRSTGFTLDDMTSRVPKFDEGRSARNRRARGLIRKRNATTTLIRLRRGEHPVRCRPRRRSTARHAPACR